MVIARAMLTGASVVIMDEVSTLHSTIYYSLYESFHLTDFSNLLTILLQATASVDGETDQRIQRVFREEFKNATCITVAHRLNTIMDSDLVLVMDDGRAAEFDTPSSLLSADGMFKSLVDAWEEEGN